MKLIHKLLLGYLVISSFGVLTTYVAIRSFHNVENTVDNLTRDIVPEITLLREMKSEGFRVLSSTHEIISLRAEGAPDVEKQIEDEQVQIQNAKTHYWQLLASYEALGRQQNLAYLSSNTADLTNAMRNSAQQLHDTSVSLIVAKNAGVRGPEMAKRRDQFEQAEEDWSAAMEVALAHELHDLSEANDVRASIAAATRKTVLVDSLTLVLGFAIGTLTAVSISRRIKRLQAGTIQVSQGTFDINIRDTSSDEIGGLARSFNLMTGKLSETDTSLRNEISERKQVEAALREREESYRDLFENAQDAIYVHDLNGTYLSVNRATEKLSGYTRNEIIGRTFADFMAPEHVERIRANLKSKLKGTGLTTYEVEVRAKDGRKIPVEVSTRLIYENGTAVSVQGMARDITERKHAEEEVRTSRERYELAVEGSNDGLWDWNMSTGDVYFSPSWKSMLGYEDHEFENCFASWEAALHPDDHARAMATIEAYVDGRTSRYALEHRLRHKDGTYRWILARAAMLRDANGKPYRMSGSHTDITERKRVEQALQESEARYRSLVETLPVIIYHVDANPPYSPLYISANVLSLGYSIDEWYGTPDLWVSSLHPDDRERVLQETEIAMGTGVETECEYRVIARDGSVIWLHDRGHLVTDSNGKRTWQGVMLDITEHKRAEMERQVSAEIVQSVITTANLDELFKLAHQAINRILPAESCFIALHNLATNVMHCEYWVDKFDPAPLPRPLGKGFSSYMLRTGQPLLLTKEFKEQMYETGKVQKSGTDSLSWLGVPLRTRSRTIGVLVVQDYKQEHAYNQRDLEFLSAVGDQLGLAIERKQIEIELKTNELRLTEAQHIAKLGSWEWDVVTNNVRWSSELYRIFGIHDDEQGQTFGKFLTYVHPDDRELTQRAIETALSDKVLHPHDYRIIRPDGTVRTLQCRGQVGVDDIGTVTRIWGTVLDVTERKQAEAELKTNEKLMSEAQRIAHLGSWEHDAASGKVKWSHEEWHIFGLEQREFGPSFEEFLAMVHPDDRHIVKRINERSQEKKEVAAFDYRIVRPDGTVRVLRANGSILCDELGQVVKITGTDQDITEQKQIEAELMKRDSELVEAQHLALMGNWEWDIATNITTWSDALYEIYGIKRGDLQPSFEGYIQLVHPDDREYVVRLAEAAVHDGQSHSYEHRILRPDKTIRHHHVKVKAVFGPDGRPIKMFGTSQDVTDRVHLENDLKQARDVAIESARLKSEFLANMSHEIRTPMNGVIGMTGLLLDTDLDEEQRDFAETIRSSGEALLTIINDILDFSKIEAGKLQFETLDFDLSNAVESTVELMAERAHGKQIELACLVYSDVTRSLCGDPGRLRQVLTNLIGNAIKFTERGEVVVRAEKDSETVADTVVRFTVTDTGIGISEAARKTLFQAFTQADGSTTRKYGGTGLGLAISKQLVELMDGEIGVTSAEGKGSTFWFTARFAKQKLPVGIMTRPNLLSLDRLHALIVDDNLTNRTILAHQLDSWGMTHEEADSGIRALELLRSAATRGTPYDLAILDFMMPGMDGFELARTIKSEPAIAAVPMVLLTSFGQRGDGASAREAGIAAYLTKPVRQSQLFDCLANVVSQASGLAEAAGSSDLVTRHTLAEGKPMSNKLILVAEDNIVNQKVAVRQLQKLGYRADTVADGREALEALGRIAYDLVLMDCQMPEMDGYEATAEIRRIEGPTKRTPVVAMTAHALTGDREKCLAAGMDEYITKPVKSEELKRVLELFLENPVVDPVDEASAGTAVLVDVKRMHEMMGDEAAEFSEILGLYLTEMGKNLNLLDAAVALGDHRKVELLAHNCAGTSANCGMNAVARPFRELEDAGRSDCLENAPATLAQAHLFFGRTRTFLDQYVLESVN